MTVPAHLGLTTTDVCKAADLSERMLNYWISVDAIRPSIREAAGSGRHRLWSQLDAIVLAAIVRVRNDLLALGVTTEAGVSTVLVAKLWTTLQTQAHVQLNAGTVSIIAARLSTDVWRCDHPLSQRIPSPNGQPERCGRCGGLTP